MINERIAMKRLGCDFQKGVTQGLVAQMERWRKGWRASPLDAVTLTNAFEYLPFCSFHRRSGDCPPYLHRVWATVPHQCQHYWIVKISVILLEEICNPISCANGNDPVSPKSIVHALSTIAAHIGRMFVAYRFACRLCRLFDNAPTFHESRPGDRACDVSRQARQRSGVPGGACAGLGSSALEKRDAIEKHDEELQSP